MRCLFLFPLLFTIGCSGKNPQDPNCPCKKKKQVLHINIVDEPQTLDPRKVRSLNDANLIGLFMEGLMRIQKDGTTAPAVAEKYSVSKDMKSYRFHLKETRWSNGDPVTAHDFVYAWKKVLTPSFLADNAFQLYPIKNAAFVKQGLLPVSMLGVNAIDDYTLAVELDQATPYFLELLTLPAFFPVHQGTDRQTPDWHKNPEMFVSNGPFQMQEWRHNDQITAVKNGNYWDKSAVKLEEITMIMVDAETGLKMFTSGEIDWEGSPFSVIPLDALASLQEKKMIEKHPLLGTYWIRVNTELAPFHTEELRKSLALAINREEIVTHIVEGVPATGIVPASFGLQDSPYFCDGSDEEAASFFNAALQKEKLTIEKLPEITLTYIADTKNHRIAQIIQDQWYKVLQISINLEPLERKIYFDRISKGDFQLACGSWVADFRDPINFLEVFKSKNIGTNNTNWESLDYQKALEASYTLLAPSERKEALKKSEEILMAEMPVIPIFHYTMLTVKQNRLKDVVLTDAGHIDFKWASFVE